MLFVLEAIQDTLLKKRPVQGSSLEDAEKKAVPKGTRYSVSNVEEVPANGHTLVTLGFGAGKWYVYGPHWKKQQLTASPTSDISWTNFSLLLTPNLSIGEVLQWDLDRVPKTNAEMANIRNTATEFQKIRDAWGSTLGVTSFFRPEPINSRVGGVYNSQHIYGKAMDIYPVGRSLDEFYKWISTRWTGGLGDGRNRGFIHLDTREGGKFYAEGGVTPLVTWFY